MKRIQKIWLGIFLAMFIVPEVLWSPVVNLVYDLLQNNNNVKVLRPNFLTISDNTTLLLFTLLVQLIGLLGSLVFVFRGKMNLFLKALSVVVLVLLSLITGFIFFVAFSLRHGIGF